MPRVFNANDLKKLYVPPVSSSGEDNGQVTIIGGSKLFHGAPFLSLLPASRMVDMVFFSSPYKPLKEIADGIKSKLLSFIWVPWNEIEHYIEKSDSILIGPGMMRFKSEKLKVQNAKLDEDGMKTRTITEKLLKKFPNKKWVIDAGALQTMETGWIPKGTVITPNMKEFELLFKCKIQSAKLKIKDQKVKVVEEKAKEHKCIIVLKGPTTIVSDGTETILVEGGNAGLTKGGTGDVLSGLTAALLAKNDPMLAAACSSYVIKKAADELYKEVGTNYNADDVAKRIPQTLHGLIL